MTKTVSLAKASAVLGRALMPKTTKGKAKAAAKKPTAKKSPLDGSKVITKRLSDAEKDKITVVKSTSDQRNVVVISAGGEMFNRPMSGDTKEFRAVAQINSSFNAAQAWSQKNPPAKPQAQLARGIESRQAPHSAKAVKDQKPAAKGKPEKKTAPKAAKNKAPSKGADRSYKVNAKVKNEARADSWRHHMTQMIVSATDTAKAKANHAKSGKFSANKLDFNWAAKQGFITFTN